MKTSVLGLAIASVVFGAVFARADHAPVFVVPGKPGVPVVINGYDASYTVVEGDWGLSRPGHVPPVIVSGPLVAPAPYYYGHYFPAYGRRPGYGRYEIEPPPDRRLPPPAPGYYREWGSVSGMAPATIADPPPNPSPVIEAFPQVEWPRRKSRRHHHKHHGKHHK
jgi:hypothetical protein